VYVWFRRLFDLAENKLSTGDDIFSLGWGVERESWK